MTSQAARPVLVGIDGSADARRALCLAGDISRTMNVGLVIVHAVGLTEVVSGRRVIAEEHHEEIAEQFTAWCEAVRSTGVERWTPYLLHGSPVDTILRVAGDVDASLVVVGRQGSGKRPELLLGSTAHQIAENSPCPVLVVPPIGRASHAASTADHTCPHCDQTFPYYVDVKDHIARDHPDQAKRAADPLDQPPD